MIDVVNDLADEIRYLYFQYWSLYVKIMLFLLNQHPEENLIEEIRPVLLYFSFETQIQKIIDIIFKFSFNLYLVLRFPYIKTLFCIL